MQPVLIVFLGVQLSGKTTLAQTVSQETGIPFINLDQVRKELFGPVLSGPKDWQNAEKETIENAKTAQGYERLFTIMGNSAKQGKSLIVEMPSLTKKWGLGTREDQLKQIVELSSAKLKIIWCYIANNEESEVKKRSDERLEDIQAAPIRPEDYYMFKARYARCGGRPALEHLAIDTSQPQEVCLAQIRKYLDA
ncbi:MAG: AAA family ATPase [Candidatus Yanofskybacteria bacterium]|nr:AAA family ATPase [Candidatus Yanofskybacteria bacterium]